MRLLQKTEDIVPVFYGPALALWQLLAVFADMNSVALAGKLLVWPLAPTDPAIVSDLSFFRFRVRITNGARWKKGLPRARPILTRQYFDVEPMRLLPAVCHEQLRDRRVIPVAYGDSHTCVEEFDRFEPIKLSAIAT